MSAETLEEHFNRNTVIHIITTIKAVKATIECFADELKHLSTDVRAGKMYDSISNALQSPPTLDGLTHNLTEDELKRLFS